MKGRRERKQKWSTCSCNTILWPIELQVLQTEKRLHRCVISPKNIFRINEMAPRNDVRRQCTNYSLWWSWENRKCNIKLCFVALFTASMHFISIFEKGFDNVFLKFHPNFIPIKSISLSRSLYLSRSLILWLCKPDYEPMNLFYFCSHLRSYFIPFNFHECILFLPLPRSCTVSNTKQNEIYAYVLLISQFLKKIYFSISLCRFWHSIVCLFVHCFASHCIREKTVNSICAYKLYKNVSVCCVYVASFSSNGKKDFHFIGSRLEIHGKSGSLYLQKAWSLLQKLINRNTRPQFSYSCFYL